MFNFLRPLFLIILIMMFTSCVAKSGPEGSGAGTSGTVNPTKASNISPAAFDEDTESIISLSYTDADGNLASSCVTSSLSNVSVTRGCACSAGVCTVGVKGTSNFNGAASFRYQVVVNGVTSANGLASLTLNAVNDAPTMVAIAAQSTNKNAVKVVSFKIADVDSTLTCASSVTATSSNLTLVPVANIVLVGTAPNCTATITPAYNLFGTSDIQLTVTDGALIAAQSFTLTVVNYNYPPTISFISNVTTNEDTAVAVNFVLDDVDSATPMVCSSANLAVYSSSNGTLIPGVNGTDVVFSGTYPNCTATFSPVLNQNGNSNIVVRASDNGSGIPAAQTGDSNAFKITVTPVDDAPVANNFSPAAFNEDTQSIITLSYADVENDKATVCTITNPTNVTVSQACACDVAGLCTVGMTGTSNYNGAASFNFSVLANGATSNAALASLTITAVDDPPVAAAITPAAFSEDVQSIITLSYTDPENDKATLCTISSLTNVTVTQPCACDGAGVCTVGVTGTSNYNGAASFNYTVTANNAVSNSVLATLTINAVNDPPVAAAITSAAFNEDTQSVITFSYTDVENDKATTCAIASPTNVTVTQACACDGGGICTVGVTGTANYNGAASFNYTVNASTADSNSAVVTLSITPVDDPPVANNFSPAAFNEDTQSIITLSYTDVDSDKAIACAVTAPTNVTVTQACACDGAGVCTVGVTGTANYNGIGSFNFTVTANGVTSANGVASLTISPVDDAPVAATITPAAFNEDLQSIITLSYTDAENDKATTCALTNLINVTVSQPCACDGAGVCTVGVTGTSNYNGAASFKYTVTANSAVSNSVLATLSITAVDDAPVAVAISPAAFNEDVQSIITLSYTDTENDLASACSITNPTNVTVTQACACASGICTVGVTGTTNYFGVASFDYTVTANLAVSNSVAATLTIAPIDDAPVAAAITPAAFNEDVQSIITLSYTDAESDVATACTITAPTNITVTQACSCNGAGVCTVGVTGTANYNGAASFNYTVTANGAISNSAAATLTISAIDDAPVAAAITPAAFNEDTQSGVITLSYTDTESDAATTCTLSNLVNVIETQACACAAGVCTVKVTGTGDYSGAASFAYIVNANGANSNNATATLTINAVDDAPVAAALTPAAFNEDTQSIITLSYTDTESDKATVCTISSLTNITVTQACSCNGAGVCTVGVTGTANYNGAAGFNYTVTANGAVSNSAAATLTISAVDDAPVAAAITPAAFNEDTQSGVITLSYTDTESDAATTCTLSNLVNVTETQACACAAGVCTVKVTGASDYNGAASFAYIVNANGANSNSATATLMINAVDDAPTVNAVTYLGTIYEDVESDLITLNYTDVDGDRAGVSDCTISNLSHVTVTQACSCDLILGSCSLKVKGTSNYFGAATFDYQIKTTTLTSTAQTVDLSITAVDDAPVANVISPAAFNEDTQSIITLSYTDAENDAASTCTLANKVNITETQACACALGVCTVGVTGLSDYNGGASFTYIVNANSANSNSATASLTISAVDDAPTINAVTYLVTIYEDVESDLITLNYTDVDGDRAGVNDCTISNLSHVTVTQACSCDFILGSCSLKVTGASNYFGAAAFDYQIKTTALTSTAQTVDLSITAVDDAPVAVAITPAAFNEDTQSNTITLSYTDTESDPATTCTLSNLVNVTETQACACALGVCTVKVTGTNNYNGAASFNYIVNANGANSNSAAATLTVNAVDDASVAAAITPAAFNEDTQTIITLSYTDAENDAATTCTLANKVNVTETQACACAAGVCTVGVTGASNYNGAASFTYIVNANGANSNSAAATLTITAVDDAPVAVAITPAAFNEDVQSIITLSYTDTESDKATACTLSSLTNVTITQACACDVNGVCTVGITGTSNYNGAASFNYTVTVNSTVSNSVAATLTINAVDDAPLITPSGALPIANQTIDEDSSTSALTFTVSDVDSAVACSSVVGTSSDQSKIANAGIVIGGEAGTNCTVTITPVANVNGSGTVITLTLGSTTATFTVDLTPVPDIAGSLTVNGNLTGVASAYPSANTYYARKLNFNNSITVDEAVSNVEVCLGTTTGGCEKVGWTALVNGAGENKYTTSGNAPTIAIAGNYKFATNNASFVLTHSCSAGATTNYYYSVRVTNVAGKKSIIDSAPWSFWEPSCLGISVLTQWLDASEASTITVATGVSAWADKSGSHRDVSQATGGNQPVFSMTELGGTLPGVTFNGTSTNLTRASFVYAQSAASIFAVAKATSSAGAEKYIFSEGNSAASVNYYAPMMNSTIDTVTGKIADDAGLGMTTAPVTDTNFFNNSVNLVMALDTGSTFTTFSNGILQTPAATAYTRGTSTIDTYSLGAKYSSGVASDWFSGTLSELMIINGALSTGDRERMEGYMAHKWGASGNLGVGHSYKAQPPAN